MTSITLMVLVYGEDSNLNIATTRTSELPCQSLKLTNIKNRQQRWREGVFVLQAMEWNFKPVYKHLIEAEFLYFHCGHWLVGSTIGELEAGLKVKITTTTPSAITGQWMSLNSGLWLPENELSLSCSSVCDGLWVSWISRDASNAHLIGAYRIAGSDDNGVPIYRKANSDSDSVVTLRMINGKKWQLSSASSILESPFMTNETNPAKIVHKWQVTGGGEIKIECYFGPIPCERFLLTGLPRHQRGLGGIYFLNGTLSNGRPVYVHESRNMSLFHVVLTEKIRYWYVTLWNKPDDVYMKVLDVAMVPGEINATWEVYSGESEQFEYADTVSVNCYTVDEINHCERFFINGVTSYQRNRQGIFSLSVQTWMNRPVYIHESGREFLYYSVDLGAWIVGPNVGSVVGGIFVSDAALSPRDIDSDAQWRIVSGGRLVTFSLKGVCLTVDKINHCERFYINGITSIQLYRRGVFTLSAQTMMNRPVYTHESGTGYLFYSTYWGAWIVGPDITSRAAGIIVNDAALTPRDININTQWRILSGDQFVPMSLITGVCLTANSCRELQVTGFNGVRSLANGRYVIRGGLLNHRASYQHTSNNYYIYYYIRYQIWIIGPQLNSDRAIATSGNVVVDAEKTTAWTISLNGQWVVEPNIRLRCSLYPTRSLPSSSPPTTIVMKPRTIFPTTRPEATSSRPTKATTTCASTTTSRPSRPTTPIAVGLATTEPDTTEGSTTKTDTTGGLVTTELDTTEGLATIEPDTTEGSTTKTDTTGGLVTTELDTTEGLATTEPDTTEGSTTKPDTTGGLETTEL
ncbi:unnamed protein product, partial [Owenia fusiformis]